MLASAKKLTRAHPELPSAPIIGVCGPVGAGKSTLTRALAAALGFHPREERVEDNPFFVRFLADRETWALASQLAFMLGALEDAAAAREHPPGVVLERPAQEMFGVFVQDLAQQGALGPDDVATLARLLRLGELASGVPDLVIVLRGDPAMLLSRIHSRGREGEQRYYTPNHMQRLEEVYDDWAKGWRRSPLIYVDVTKVDLRTAPAIASLVDEVHRAVPESTRPRDQYALQRGIAHDPWSPHPK
jgi:deoxyadenosine/deoxycytidine kinase